MSLDYKAFIDAKKNRIVGAILHAVDSKAPIPELKQLIKSKLAGFSKDMVDLCNAIEGVPLVTNPLAEVVRKQVEIAEKKK